MKASWWNQYWEHEEIVSSPPEETYERLLSHYKQSSKSFVLDKESFPSEFSFQRGHYWISALSVGSELWAKHFVNVVIREIEMGKTLISWTINIKVCGLQAGKNAIIEECKNITVLARSCNE